MRRREFMAGTRERGRVASVGTRATGGQTANHRAPGCERYGLEFPDNCLCDAVA